MVASFPASNCLVSNRCNQQTVIIIKHYSSSNNHYPLKWMKSSGKIRKLQKITRNLHVLHNDNIIVRMSMSSEMTHDAQSLQDGTVVCKCTYYFVIHFPSFFVNFFLYIKTIFPYHTKPLLVCSVYMTLGL